MRRTPQLASTAEFKGLVLNMMRFSLHDGPGIRTTIFFKGCPLSCSWCHNPESQDPRPEVMYARDRCVGCGDCLNVCEPKALSFSDGHPVRQTDLCLRCGKCAAECMTEARRFVGSWYTVDEAMSEIRRDTVFFDESGGGVTFSGGEPLMQADFLEAALTACKAEGIHTAVDTCGYVRAETLARISNKTDLFLFDLKMVDAERHKRFTGVENATIIENLAMLVKAKKRVIVRIPIVPQVNDDDENICLSMQLLSRIGVPAVDLLAYHETGVDKCKRLGMEYGLGDVKPPSVEKMHELSDRFRAEGFTVRIGG